MPRVVCRFDSLVPARLFFLKTKGDDPLGDLKPENLLYVSSESDMIKLADFGSPLCVLGFLTLYEKPTERRAGFFRFRRV